MWRWIKDLPAVEPSIGEEEAAAARFLHAIPITRAHGLLEAPPNLGAPIAGS
jgi:hypothetical protein